MTLIRPVRQSDIAIQEKIRKIIKEADLNLSETMAINEEFDLDLEYSPKEDVVQFTTYHNNEDKHLEPFSERCIKKAKEYGITICHFTRHSNMNDFQTNLNRALNKIKQAFENKRI